MKFHFNSNSWNWFIAK